MRGKVDTKAQAVEERARTEHAIVTACLTRNIGKRIGGIRDCYQHRLRRGAHDLWDDGSIDRGVLFEQPKSALRIAAICCTACLFVDARSDKHHAGSGERVVIAISDIDFRTQRHAVANVGRDRLRRLAGAVHEHDFPRAAARHRRQCNGAAHISGADDTELHGPSPSGVLTNCRLGTTHTVMPGSNPVELRWAFRKLPSLQPRAYQWDRRFLPRSLSCWCYASCPASC